MPAVVGGSITVQPRAAAVRADRGIAHDRVRDAIFGQVAIEQPCIEWIRFERDDGFDRFALRGMHRVPSKIGADIDEQSGWCGCEVMCDPASRYRLMNAVFGNMASNEITEVHEER